MRLPLIAARGFESHPLRHGVTVLHILCKAFFIAESPQKA